MPPSEIACLYTDARINARLSRLPSGPEVGSPHFNQVEEFFLRLPQEFSVPQLPIHHDVRDPQPREEYLHRLREVIDQLSDLVPQVFRGLSYLFDPSEILRPGFFRVHERGGSPYLYLVRLNLTHRPLSDRVLIRGDNDRTAAFTTRNLYLDAALIPLQEVAQQPVPRFVVDETISNTWISQTGRGYFVQGIWMDNDLTRFFSKLLLPAGLRSHPYYPYVCRYRTVCQSLVRMGEQERERLLPGLHAGLRFLRPVMAEVEQAMRGSSFSEANPVYRQLKSRVPEEWYAPWKGLRVEAYLNDQDMKEYRVEHPPD